MRGEQAALPPPILLRAGSIAPRGAGVAGQCQLPSQAARGGDSAARTSTCPCTSPPPSRGRRHPPISLLITSCNQSLRKSPPEIHSQGGRHSQLVQTRARLGSGPQGCPGSTGTCLLCHPPVMNFPQENYFLESIWLEEGSERAAGRAGPPTPCRSATTPGARLAGEAGGSAPVAGAVTRASRPAALRGSALPTLPSRQCQATPVFLRGWGGVRHEPCETPFHCVVPSPSYRAGAQQHATTSPLPCFYPSSLWLKK